MALPPLLVNINGDSSGLDSALGKAGKSLKNLGVIAGAAAVAVVGGLAAMTAAGLRNVDTNVKLARSMDGTVNALTAVQVAAGYAGVSVGEANTSMQTLNRELASANEAGSPAAKALDRLGMSAAALSALDTDDRMASIADRVKELGLSSSQASDILRDLGVRSRNMALLMIQGGDAIRSAREEVTAFGLELTDAQTAGIESANDAVARMSLVFQGLSQMLAAEVAPVLQVMADRFNSIASSEATQEAIQRVVTAFGQLAEIILSEDFMGAAASGLAMIAGAAADLAQGMVYLSQNTDILYAGMGVLIGAAIALGGPLTVLVGIIGLATAAYYTLKGATKGASDASNVMTVAMGDEITQSQLLDRALATNGQMSVEVAKVKLAEAQARYENVSAIIAENRALALNGSSYTNLTTSIDTAQDAMRGLGERTVMNSASYDETEQTLADQIERRQRLLDVDEAAAEQLVRTQENINSLTDKIANSTGGMVTTGDGAVVPITPTAPGTGTGGGGPTAGVGSAGAVTNEMQARLDALTQGMMTEAETVQEWYEAGDETLRAALDAELITRAEYDEQKLRLEAEHQEKLGKIKGQEMEVTKGVLDRVAGLMQTSNAKLFKIGQAAAIARATISGYEAAVESYKWGAARGGPALGAALAAVSLAQTGAMISSIASQSPSGSSGGGGGGGSAGGASAATAPPQAPLEARVTGFGPNDLFNGGVVTSLFNKLQDEAGDRGLRVSFAT